MKKVSLFCLLLLCTIGVMAQRVVYDQTNATGVRTVVCEGMNLGAYDGVSVYVALAGLQYKSTVRYSLVVTIGADHEVSVPAGSRCVLTLDNGKLLELPTVGGGAAVLQQVDVVMDEAYANYRRFAYYNFRTKDLKKLLKNGLAQVDFPLQPNSYVVSFPQNELGQQLAASYTFLKSFFDK
ncbi:hypothetical protein, secreted [gut metagenome]|uniref:Uncharacterized protein n=1 Tax=gut metagenome TaxID=749906 RepID=J9GTA0_9ZZZZ